MGYLKILPLLFVAIALSSCETAAQNGGTPVVASNDGSTAMIQHDQEMVARGVLPSSVLQIDAQLAKTRSGSPRYEALWKQKLAVTQQQYHKLDNEGRLGSFTSPPVPLGGTYAPGNIARPQSGPDLGAIGWKPATSCVYPDGPTGPSICN